jgi:ion channel POLLUX/CASTOR
MKIIDNGEINMKSKHFRLVSERFLIGSFKFQITALIVFSLIIIVTGSIFIAFFREHSFFEALWWSFLRITDPGHLANDMRPAVRFISAVISISGWVIFGLLISIISNSIQSKLNEMQKGRGAVHYENHTVILGWNQNMFSVLDELVVSQHQDDAPVVVMSNKSPEEMFNGIRSFCKHETVKNVVCRNGNPESSNDQLRVNVVKADNIIVLNNHLELGLFNADASALKTILALNKNIKDYEAKKPVDHFDREKHIVVEISQPAYLRFIEGIIAVDSKHNNIKHYPIVMTEIFGKILTSCALQPGMSKVYDELFSYYRSGNYNGTTTSEIYLRSLSSFGIKERVKFEDLIFGFDQALPIGFKKVGENSVLNPHVKLNETEIYLDPADELIYIADDDRVLTYVEPSNLPTMEVMTDLKNQEAFEKRNVLVLGSGFKAELVVNELCKFLDTGSEITCSGIIESRIKTTLNNHKDNGEIKLHYHDMKKIDSIIFHLIEGQGGGFDLIIFADEIKDPNSYDARSLMILAGINSAFKQCKKKPRIVMELFDSKNAELAQNANADDVIIGSELLSNYIVQVTKVPERHAIYEELLTAGGSELYIKPIELYTKEDKILSFKELMVSARNRNEIAIGYTYEENNQFRYAINPPPNMRDIKNEHIQKALVLAEDCS